MAPSDTFGQINREFWNEHAHTLYKEDWVRKINDQVQDCIQQNAEWINARQAPANANSPVKLLDYACGFGSASMAMLDSFDTIRGIDISESMVNGYNELAKKLGLHPDRMAAVQGNLLDEPSDRIIDGPEFFDAEAIVMTMALHHIKYPSALLSKMVQRLRPCGVVIIVDWLDPSPALTLAGSDTELGSTSDDPSSQISHDDADDHHHVEPHQHAQTTIARAGFSEQDLRLLFKLAGCEESSFGVRSYGELSLVPEHRSGVRGGMERTLFIAKGRKPL
ncbi:S-adenosyl-L-methionine-dependent methyltransferase [Xylariaceae sp. FL1272]|nr:S-adenosyl-L-methionine-dependent methyltransferase [Xylariaceae sp. FL1272]